MSTIELSIARDLIKKKKYNQARDILVKLDDPTAKRWLTKIDEITASDNLVTSNQKDNKEFIDRWNARNNTDKGTTFSSPLVTNSSSETLIAGISSTVIIATLSIMLFVTFTIAIYGAFLRPSTIVEAQSNQQWEYLILNANLGFYTEYEILTHGQLSQEAEIAMENALQSAGEDWIILSIYLNALGNEGWILEETVAIWDDYDGAINYIFRRPK